jgi:hypothetical protein
MITFFLLLLHAAGLAFAIFSIMQSGQRPQVLLYAFILDYLLRLTTIGALGLPSFRFALPYVTRTPFRGQQSQPVRRGEEANAPPGNFGTYLIVMAALAGFAFVLVHVNSDRELSLDAATFERDLAWGIVIGLVYWIEGLATRTIVIDPNARVETNFGYNTRDVTILAFAVLTAGLVVAARQEMDLPPSGWAVLGPLLAFRAIYDFHSALKPLRSARE